MKPPKPCATWTGNSDILEGLTSLVDNSLLRQEEADDGEPRFGMLETIRAYAVERLAESGETAALQAGHAQYFGNIVVNQAGFEIYSAKALHWLTWFERELDNIRATLNWCLATPQGLQLAWARLHAVFWFWYRRGHFIEGLHWAEKFLRSPMFKTSASACPGAGFQRHDGALAGGTGYRAGKLQEALRSSSGWRMTGWWDDANGEWVAFINMGNDGEANPCWHRLARF